MTSTIRPFPLLLVTLLPLSACEPAFGDASVGKKGNPAKREPAVHRPTAAACAKERPPGHPDPKIKDGCTSDKACADAAQGTLGRCDTFSMGRGGSYNSCSYDQCFSDDECKRRGRKLCICNGSWTGRNVCHKGNCRVDADCGAGGFCSPSYAEGEATCRGGAEQAWYCHTAADECVDTADCPRPKPGQYDAKSCLYKPTIGRWACVTDAVCPPG